MVSSHLAVLSPWLLWAGEQRGAQAWKESSIGQNPQAGWGTAGAGGVVWPRGFSLRYSTGLHQGQAWLEKDSGPGKVALFAYTSSSF